MFINIFITFLFYCHSELFVGLNDNENLMSSQLLNGNNDQR